MKPPLETADNLSKILNRCAYLKAKISASNNDEQKKLSAKISWIEKKISKLLQASYKNSLQLQPELQKDILQALKTTDLAIKKIENKSPKS